MSNPNNLKVKIFADGADLKTIKNFNENPLISGFTTNPTLMRISGVSNYEKFVKDACDIVVDKPISFEVISDNLKEMESQARRIASWADNVYVKIPIYNTKKEPTKEIIKNLNFEGVKINVTAVFTNDQVNSILDNINKNTNIVISIFAGRIADTGEDPEKIICNAITNSKEFSNVEILWASPREVYNIIQADKIGCHIITATKNILDKLSLFGKSLDEYSLETVKMFYEDARSSQFKI